MEKKPVAFQSLDLYNNAEVNAFSKELANRAPYDLMVNSAGYFFPIPFLKQTRENYHQYHQINESFFFLIQTVTERMVKEKIKGSIVNIGSMWARQAIKATPSSSYSMAKAGLHALTLHLAMELSDYGIRVNAVSPAVVETPIYGSFIKPSEIHEQLQGFNAFHPISRIGTPEDVSSVIDFLLSDAASWDVDGGVMAGRN